MLIVTQKKSGIVNLKNMETISVEPEAACFNAGYNIFARGVDGKSVTLGRYKDKKRANEVLKEILEEYRVLTAKTVYEMPEA